MDKTCDFSGWATRNNLRCSDGRIIMKDAFKHCDGKKVPLIWQHNYDSPDNVLGHALLENRDEGVYAYCSFNNSDRAKTTKALLQHGDICSLSIAANQLQQRGSEVLHGVIREVSLVLAGANPGAFIDSMVHGEESEDEAIIFTGEDITIYHADEPPKPAEKEAPKPETTGNTDDDDDETVQDVIDSMSEKQKNVLYALVGAAIEDNDEDESDEDNDNSDNNDKGGNNSMKHNVFDTSDESVENDYILTHDDQTEILNMAKNPSVGSLQSAIQIFAENNDSMAHGFDTETLEQLFPDYKDVKPGAPELITRDQNWIGSVMQKVHKSPISRIRTRQMDVRDLEGPHNLRGFGYNNRQQAKHIMGNPKLLNRTTDPQTVYVKDKLHRDDIIDITDFSVVDYLNKIMRMNLDEEIARAILIGDGREEGDDNKIHQEHIRSIFNDDDLYAIHADVDFKKAEKELQGTETDAHFGENYIYAEAIITAALYAREQYKGSGSLDFYCTPHLLNVMLLARDLNGRRIYESKTDLAAALDVNNIYTVEQFEGQTRKDKSGKEKKLLGIFVNLADYQVGSTKGGEISRFEDFDIDFNQYKYLMETRLSGALIKVYSAIVLEEPSGE